MTTKRRKVSAAKGTRKGSKFTPDQVNEMLFWWVFCDENYGRAASIISEKFAPRKVNRTVLRRIVIREDFHVKAPFVKKAVEVYKNKYLDLPDSEREPQAIHFTEMGRSMLEIDWQIVRKAKKYIASSGRSKDTAFKSVKEMVDALRFVQENVMQMIGQTNLRKDAFDNTDAIEGGVIQASATDLMKQISKSQQNEVVNELEAPCYSWGD